MVTPEFGGASAFARQKIDIAIEALKSQLQD
jgi:hypothetical protein